MRHLNSIVSHLRLLQTQSIASGLLLHGCYPNVHRICEALAGSLMFCLGFETHRVLVEHSSTVSRDKPSKFRSFLSSSEEAEDQFSDNWEQTGSSFENSMVCVWIQQQAALLGSMLVLACGRCSICQFQAYKACRELSLFVMHGGQSQLPGVLSFLCKQESTSGVYLAGVYICFQPVNRISSVCATHSHQINVNSIARPPKIQMIILTARSSRMLEHRGHTWCTAPAFIEQ
jgi:hypothetical protein